MWYFTIAPNFSIVRLRLRNSSTRELFTKKFTDLLESFGHTPESAHQTVLTLLPDILDYDYTPPEGYPNGRNLTDDTTFSCSVKPTRVELKIVCGIAA